MNFLTVVFIGLVFGALGGVGIFFEPKEALQMADPLRRHIKRCSGCTSYRRWWSAMAIGAFYGLAFSLVIYLAKGGSKSGDAPYVIPDGIITGALSGLFIVIWAVKTI